MKSIKRPDQYLRLSQDIWHYVRRVHKAVQYVEDRAVIHRSLDTDSRKVARQRRDICAAADDQRWHQIAPNAIENLHPNAILKDLHQHAQPFGYAYVPAKDLAQRATLEDVIERIDAMGPLTKTPKMGRDADALLGLVDASPVPITQALQIYLSEIALDEQSGKSPEQLDAYIKVKRRAVANFVKINGDLAMREITRDHAQALRKFWADRIHPTDGSKPMSGSSGNKDLGFLRKLYRRYFEHTGEEERQNPFRNLRFSPKILKKVKPFSNDWVQNEILKPDLFRGLNREAALLLMVLIETGCRLSELTNIEPKNIRLRDEIPHLRIRPTSDRELKSSSSERDIPLVGIALEAMKRAPDGFPHYRDRGYLLSQALLKAFKSRNLLPSKHHRVYSLRHSFEKRMLEGGLDYGLRCTLMGHKSDRPEYGDGGSLEYRRQELLKIVHPVKSELLEGYPFTA
ncbi:tyrosine-type recombinase/integrase [Litorimonas sp. WD9-15]|uniref:tyrosine-type recombinase/integrase n=1 Tax=Litorimonas sp. WD9-15 TaxID=3418716 RepID=UPI003D087820